MEFYQNLLIFETFDEAMNVHRKLFEIMRNNHVVTYADVISIISEEEVVFHDDFYKYGWTNLFNSKVEPYGDNFEWILRMPKMKKLEKEND